jgi:TP901 family phage tail tape measure protein
MADDLQHLQNIRNEYDKLLSSVSNSRVALEQVSKLISDIDAKISKASQHTGNIAGATTPVTTSVAYNEPVSIEEALMKAKKLNEERNRLERIEKEKEKEIARIEREAIRREINAPSIRSKEAFSFRFGETAAKNVEKYFNQVNITRGLYNKGEDEFFDFSKLTSAYGTGAGYTNLTYRFRDSDKVLQKLNITLDKHGRVINDTQKRYRSFGDAIRRDIVEVAKWSTAVALVYMPARKLEEVLQNTIENEAKMADVSIALGSSTKQLSNVFSEVADIANIMGEEINTVIDAYVLAYRATGDITDQNERLAVTSKLLADALTLSKLSGMEEAEAMDSLTASLRQMNMPLTDGTTLLDTWVKTTRIANVDLETLAAGFATLGDASESAGMSAEEFNAVIATVAETGLASGREAANAARALVAGFQSDKAREELQKLGISITDETGKIKGFLDIMKEVAALRVPGKELISEGQFSELTLALGGGTRRQALFSTFISSLSRVYEIMEGQTNSAGSAQEALGKKLDTVQTHIVKLNNAFMELSNTLGTKGGVLELMKDILGVATSLVDVINKLTGGFGKASMLLALTGVASLALGGDKNEQLRENLRGRFIYGAISGGVPTNIASTIGTYFGKSGIEGMGVQRNLGYGLGTQLGFGSKVAALSSVGSLLPAIYNFREGKIASGIADIAGGFAGAFIGGPLGAAVGSAIAEAFVSATIDHKPDLQDMLKDVTYEATKSSIESQDQTLESLYETAQRRAGGGNIFLGQTRIALEAAGTAILAPIANLALSLNGINKRMQGMTVNQVTRSYLTQQEIAPVQATYETKAGFQGTYFSDLMSKQLSANAPILNDIIARQSEKLRQQLIQKTITSSQFQEMYENIGTASEVATRYLVAFGEQYDAISDKVSGTNEVLEDFVELIVRSSPEEISTITQLSSSIASLMGEIEALKSAGQDASEQQVKLNKLTKDAATYYNQLRNSFDKSKGFNLPSIIDLSDVDYTSVIAKAFELQHAYIQGIIAEGLVPDGTTEEQIISTFEDLFIQIGEKSFKKQTGLGAQFLQDAAKQMQKDFNIVNFNATSLQLQQAYAQYKNRVAEMTQIFGPYGWKENPEVFGYTTTDDQKGVTKLDLKVFQLLLEEIADNTEKTVDGIYNLPEGAEFYAPITALYYRPKNPLLPDNTVPGIGLPLPTPDVETSKAVTATVYPQSTRDPNARFKYRFNYGYTNPVTIGTTGMQGSTNYAAFLKEENKPYETWSNTNSLLSQLTALFSNLKFTPQITMGALGNLNIELSLIADGVKLWEVIKPVALKDLIRFEGVAGSLSRNVM